MKKINVGWGGHREESKIINKFHSQWKKNYPSFIKIDKKNLIKHSFFNKKVNVSYLKKEQIKNVSTLTRRKSYEKIS